MNYSAKQNLTNLKNEIDSKNYKEKFNLTANQYYQLEEKLMYKHKQIEELSKRFKVLVEDFTDVIGIIDCQGKIMYISETSKKVIGYKREEVIGKNILDFFQGKDKERIMEMMDFVLNNPNKTVQGDVTMTVSKLNIPIYLEMKMKNLLNEPIVEGLVVYMNNITRRVEMEKRMAHISTHDSLTGLPNRIYFRKQLKIQCEHVQKTKSKFALMMLEIGGLKYVNYSLGYEMGDKFILEIVNRLKSYLGENMFLSRYSEDHFAVIVPGEKSKQEYDDMGRGLVDLFKTPFTVGNYDLDAYVNVGICICPYDGQDGIQSESRQKSHYSGQRERGKIHINSFPMI